MTLSPQSLEEIKDWVKRHRPTHDKQNAESTVSENECDCDIDWLEALLSELSAKDTRIAELDEKVTKQMVEIDRLKVRLHDDNLEAEKVKTEWAKAYAQANERIAELEGALKKCCVWAGYGSCEKNQPDVPCTACKALHPSTKSEGRMDNGGQGEKA